MTTGLLITALGQAAIAADLGGGADLVLTHVAFGDAAGVPYVPNEAQTALVNERYRSTIASVAVVAGAIVVDAIIPADTPDGSARPSHGFNVAEAGLFSAAGTMIGVARMGNGFKPSPLSGQAQIATFRFKLAVANPSAITVVIDPQAQLIIGRHVRAAWITVDGVENVPPVAPALGATYLIGAAPTGAWAGFAHRIAQWVGVWSLATVPVGHHIVDNSKGIDTGARWLERTAGGWAPGLSRLIQKRPGNYAVTTGTANALVVTLDPAPDVAMGFQFHALITETNTGSCSLNLNDEGPIAVKRLNGAALSGGELVKDTIAGFVRRASGWQMTAPVSFSRVTRRIYGTSDTYTPSVGMVFADVELCGGGGGGGGAFGAPSPNVSAGSGGGGAAYARRLYTATEIGVSAAIVIGAGGGGGVSQVDGTQGGNSKFTPAAGGAIMDANGGGGGPFGVTATVPTRGGFLGGGGSAAGGSINIQGCASGWPLLFGGAYTAVSGKGGRSFLGEGGQEAQENASGNHGQGYGGGGSGAAALTAGKQGGSGFQGVCIITEYILEA